MKKLSVLFDAPKRSGNHFALALLTKSFPSVNFFWGYKNQHKPKSFTISKEKVNYILTVLRYPLDSIVSTVVVWKQETKETILSSIDSNKKMLQSMLDNANNIHISLFEDLTNNTPKYISDVSKILKTQPNDLDYNDIKDKLKDYYDDFLYVAPIDNQVNKDIARKFLLDNYKKEIDECIDLYNLLQKYITK